MKAAEAPLGTLQAAFAARNDWHTNRSSAIFPVRLRDGADLLVVYLNYWTIKNKIDGVQQVVRLYDETGSLHARYTERVSGTAAELSVRDLFSVQGDFDGMIEIEFISLENLRFSFPAIQGFYRAGNVFSSVHSAGRIKNVEEPQPAPPLGRETNWICKFERGITPFFHVFRDGKPLSSALVQLDVLSPAKNVIASKQLSDLLAGPFSSRMVILDEVFPELWESGPPADGSYCRVTLPQDGIFPRLVVGNLHRANDFLEVTHSFGEQQVQDFVSVPAGVELASFIPALRPDGLDLSLYSFPTNSAATIDAALRVQLQGTARLEASGALISWTTGGEGAKLFRYAVDEKASLVSLDLRGSAIPSRLNISYRFSVSGVHSTYSTDIATGAKSCAYPPKHSHWGTSIAGAGFNTTLMVRNMSHNPLSTKASKGLLKVWLGDAEVRLLELEVGAEAGAFYVLDAADWPVNPDEPHFVHWLANFDQPSVEMFWASHAEDGRICGDHAF